MLTPAGGFPQPDAPFGGSPQRLQENEMMRTSLPRPPVRFTLLGLVSLVLLGQAIAADAQCYTATINQYSACRFEAQDDYYTARAICYETSSVDRFGCLVEARWEYSATGRECRDQFYARLKVCRLVGLGPYDPDWEPENFETDFNQPSSPNPWYPLIPGTLWVFESEDETTTITVEDATKDVEGVDCIVVRDVVSEGEDLIEDTDDWFALSLDGDVFYCGEEVKDYEYFDGDDPREAELVEIEGSFKHGRDGDKAGLLFPGDPRVGDAYRQEWSAGNAEDVAMVLSTSYGYGNDSELDEFAPEGLVELLCDDDCVVTKEWTPLEPGVVEYKYFAPGIGPFLEVKPDDGEIAQLVECNVHPLCEMLPEP